MPYLPDHARPGGRPAVLWLSNETPDVHGQGGQRRQYFQIAELVAQGFRIRCVTLAGPQDDTSLRQLVEVERISPRVAARIPDLLAKSRLRKQLRSHEWSAVVVAHLESWPLLQTRPHAPVLIDVHNVMSAWLEKHGDAQESARFEQREREVLGQAEAVAVCSTTERDRLPPGDGADRLVVPHGIDPAEWRTAPPEVSPPVVGMFGNWSWAPNAAGLEWFLDDVWPRVHALAPDAVCAVAGGGAPIDADARPGVRVDGRVPDVASFAAGCRTVVVPVRSGVGAPVKFGESLAAGRPVVATTDGASAHPDSPAVVTDDPETMASVLLDLLDDEVTARKLGQQCRDYALDEISWSRTTAPLVDWIRRSDHA